MPFILSQFYRLSTDCFHLFFLVILTLLVQVFPPGIAFITQKVTLKKRDVIDISFQYSEF